MNHYPFLSLTVGYERDFDIGLPELTDTTVYRDPEWADVKLAQAKYLLSRIVKFQDDLRCNVEASPLVLVCGDYNSTPGDRVNNSATINLWRWFQSETKQAQSASKSDNPCCIMNHILNFLHEWIHETLLFT
jgi:hypothetical protein